jgi:signal transduction histidine kinase
VTHDRTVNACWSSGKFDTAVIIAVGVTLVVAALLGDVVRSRRELAASQRAALELHGREQAAAMERLVLEERSRLARELHDSVGHAINVMVMQAGVGRHVFAERPQFAHEALEHVETVGRVGLGELDAVLRVLHPDDGEPVAEPVSATLAELETLCHRIRATGREVGLHADDVHLEPSAERAAYRIVQEAITNAARLHRAGDGKDAREAHLQQDRRPRPHPSVVWAYQPGFVGS